MHQKKITLFRLPKSLYLFFCYTERIHYITLQDDLVKKKKKPPAGLVLLPCIVRHFRTYW